MPFNKNMQDFMVQSMEGLRLQQQAHSEAWGLDRVERWDVDLESGTISFSFKDGTVAIAPVQVVGTYNPEDSTFLWGWDHPSIPEAVAEHAKQVLTFGREHHIENFMTRKVTCTEAEAWEFTAVAVRLAGANGGYRGDAGGPLVYMTFGEVRLQRQKE
ncbi:DUF6882 domain-containing protein [Acetonema longum]|uniref:Uncharacterized protein n=1 Tax=Acetonema longum DSM 6540 TaxID=1009370 RepID=F7NLJ0_9FIRM|nr:DUF6882 domain-containing protein [Acetonema longum]EGO63085.1 hypothetical protein ALO_14812 [Acetonema longum DSM 6540]